VVSATGPTESLRNHFYLIHYMFRPLWVILRCYQLQYTYYYITTRGRRISLIHQDPELLLVCIYTLLGGIISRGTTALPTHSQNCSLVCYNLILKLILKYLNLVSRYRLHVTSHSISLGVFGVLSRSRSCPPTIISPPHVLLLQNVWIDVCCSTNSSSSAVCLPLCGSFKYTQSNPFQNPLPTPTPHIPPTTRFPHPLFLPPPPTSYEIMETSKYIDR
jgi:hypothetical protein